MEERLENVPETPVLENTSRINRELYMEAVRGRAAGWRSRLAILLGVLVAVAGLLMHWPILTVLGLLYAVGRILTPAVTGRRDFGRLLEKHPEGEWNKTVRFYSDHIETDSGLGGPTVAHYKNIRREIETPRLYIIDFGKSAPATMLCKDGFTRGSLEELRAFLTARQRAEYDPPHV